jgi:hypothetical protein
VQHIALQNTLVADDDPPQSGVPRVGTGRQRDADLVYVALDRGLKLDHIGGLRLRRVGGEKHLVGRHD